jgi:hypothetical protein
MSGSGKNPKVEVYDVLSKYRKEESEQYRGRQDPEFQAMEMRSQVSKVGPPIPGGAGMVVGAKSPNPLIEDMFQMEDMG